MVIIVPRIKEQQILELFEHVLNLETKEELYRFFQDLTTQKEIEDMAFRFYLAKQLYEGKTYQQIEDETSTSATTIARANKMLKSDIGMVKKAFEKNKQ